MPAVGNRVEIDFGIPGATTRSESRPFGDRLTCPPAFSGALATKNTCCASMNS
jgi:hypothetical protein